MECIDFKRFMFEQKIKQSDLAKYLGVSEGYISQVACGKKQLSEENYSKVLNNPYGWDTSMLTEGKPENAKDQQPYTDFVKDRLLNLIDDQAGQIKMLLGMLKDKDEEIRQLREELDERKRGNAQSAGTSSSVNAAV